MSRRTQLPRRAHGSTPQSRQPPAAAEPAAPPRPAPPASGVPAPPPPPRPCSPSRAPSLSSLPFPGLLFLLLPTRSRPSSSFRGSRWVEQSPGPPPSGACASLGSAHTFQVTQADPRSGRSTERKGVFVIAGLGPRGQTTYLGAGEQAEMIDCVICVPREGRRACRGSHTGARSPRPPARECLTSPSRGCLCSFYNTVLRVHAE